METETMEFSENLNLQNFLESLQFPYHEYMNDKSERTDEYVYDIPGPSHISDTNADKPNLESFNLEELDNFFSNEVGILHSSDISTDDQSLSDESELDVSDCSSVSTGLSDISDEDSEGSDYHLSEDCGIDLENFDDLELINSALSKNRELQKKLIEAIEKIKTTLNEKEALTKKIQGAKEEITRKETKEPVLCNKSLFLSPYFAEPGPIGICPPRNEDSIAKIRNNDMTAFHYPSKIWSYYEKARLLQGVYAVALDYVLKPINRRHDFLKEKIANQRKEGTLIKYQEIEMKEEMLQHKFMRKQKCRKAPKEIIQEAGDNIDWMRISAQFFEGRRSEEDCELMWNNYQSIFVNRKPFSLREDRKLKKLAKLHNEKNWDLIVQELQTGRTAFQCCSRYHSRLNRNIEIKGYFTPDESAKLLRVVEEVRKGDFISWQKVKLYINGRKSTQVANHYRLVVKETLDRSPFTKEEDAMILACVKKFGPRNWTKMEKYLPHRTYLKIQRRYDWFLNPFMKIDPWSDEENFKLIRLVKKYGFGRWAEIAKLLPGRSNTAIRKHMVSLFTKDKSTNKVRFKTYEEIRKMSQPFPHKLREAQLKRRKFIIDSAYETLKSALEKIYYHLKNPITVENLSSISFPGLRMLQRELMKRKKKSIRWNINMNWKTCFPNTEPDIQNNENMSDSDDEAENVETTKETESNWANPKVTVKNEYINSIEKKMEEEEKEWLQKVLHSQIEEEVNREPVPYKVDKIIASLDLASTVEYSMYEDYLQKELAVSKTGRMEEDSVTWVFNEHNYKTSLPKVIHHFVHPPASRDQRLVLPPNWATLYALDRILASDSKLRKTSNLIDHSVAYLRYLLNLSDQKPKCVHCSQEENAGTSYEDYKVALDTLKSHLIIPTTEMKSSAMVETTFPAAQMKECKCNKLIESKSTVELLSKRFIALFLWPYFLQSVEPRKHQMDIVLRAERCKLSQRKYKYSKGKRKHKNADNGCFKKKRPREELEWTTSEEELDKASCSTSERKMSARQSQTQNAQNEIEVVCLSDTPEDFCYVERTEYCP